MKFLFETVSNFVKENPNKTVRSTNTFISPVWAASYLGPVCHFSRSGPGICQIIFTFFVFLLNMFCKNKCSNIEIKVYKSILLS